VGRGIQGVVPLIRGIQGVFVPLTRGSPCPSVLRPQGRRKGFTLKGGIQGVIKNQPNLCIRDSAG